MSAHAVLAENFVFSMDDDGNEANELAELRNGLSNNTGANAAVKNNSAAQND